MSTDKKRSAVTDVFSTISKIILMPFYIFAAVVAIICSTISS